MAHVVRALICSPWILAVACVAVLGFVAYAVTIPWRANREARQPEEEP